jgi:phosphoglycolate phosphatase
MKPFDLVMFDLDGTLVETAPEIMDAVNDVLSRFDLPLVTQQQVNDWIGHGTLELLVKALTLVSQRDPEEVRHGAQLGQMVPVYNQVYGQRCGTRSQLYPARARPCRPCARRVSNWPWSPTKKAATPRWYWTYMG